MKRKTLETQEKIISRRKKTAPKYLQDYTQEHKKARTSYRSHVNLFAKNGFFQQASLDVNASHYYLNNTKDIQRFAADRNIVYVKPTKPKFIEFQNKLKLATCNVLQSAQNTQALGAYTTKPIWVEPNTIKVIGHYVGNLLEDGEENPDSSFVFELPNGKIIDASERCNFTAVINGAMSEQMSNIKIQTCQTPSGDNFIEYYICGGEKGVFIQSGSQLIGFYGSTAKYDDYEFGKKFLTPRDLPLTSAELYAKYSQYDAYCDTPATLDKEFLKLFNITANTFFAVPKTSKLTDFFDIQYLAYKPRAHALTPDNLLHQNLQENITPLMLACWRGDLDEITKLLRNGANPSIPSTNCGYTAFHITMFSQINTDTKIQIINLLSQERGGAIHKSLNGQPILDIIKPNLTKVANKLYWYSQVDLTAQDKHERTIAHIAIEQANLEITQYLLEKDVRFWNYQDGNGRDILEAAIISGNITIINCLLANIRNLKDTNTSMYQEIIDYQLCQNNTLTPPLFSALECLYNDKQDNLEVIVAIYNTIRENFVDILSTTQKKRMDAAYRRAINKTPNNISGLFKIELQQSSIESGSTMEITI